MEGVLIAIAAVLTFVTSNVIFRRTEQEASPTFINFIRTLIGTITFLLLALGLNIFFQIFLLPVEIWIILIVSFIFGQVIGDTAYFIAQKELGTTNALAVSMTFPLITFILSIIFLNDPFDIRIVFSIILVGSGIYIINKNKMDNQEIIVKKDLNSKLNLKSISFGLIAAFGWAIGLIIIDFASNEIDRILLLDGLSSIVGNVIRFPFALIILFSMVLREKFKMKILDLKLHRSIKTWAILIFGAVIGTSLGAYLYTEAARVAGATIMSLIASASPLFSLPLTYVINNEKVSKFGFIGVILTIFGVIMIIF